MLRRALLSGSTAVGATWMASVVGRNIFDTSTFHEDTTYPLGPIRSYEPVVGDGKWIWREPPAVERGYLEPRTFDLSIGIELQGTGDRSQAIASTPVPTNHPEQTVDQVTIEKVGCDAVIRELAPGATQLVLQAPSIMAGQTVRAIAHYKLTIRKHFEGFQQEQFPVKQVIPTAVRNASLGDSPGIQTGMGVVRKLAAELTKNLEHPWEKAQLFAKWVRENIRPQYQPYTSVTTAIEKKVGDCEEMSAVFVALCRTVGIPSRLVWVPNHNWAEIYLSDTDEKGHWIPVHPACYHWFGWTGAHELVLQKGDRIKVPEQNRPVRLIMDWLRSSGARPKATYIAELKPTASTTGEDAGPGTRTKDSLSGEWKLTGNHPMDRYARR